VGMINEVKKINLSNVDDIIKFVVLRLAELTPYMDKNVRVGHFLYFWAEASKEIVSAYGKEKHRQPSCGEFLGSMSVSLVDFIKKYSEDDSDTKKFHIELPEEKIL
jgi:hypothetical protein